MLLVREEGSTESIRNSYETVTSVAAGTVGDKIGRRGTLFVGALVFTLGGAIQTFTVGFWSMIVGRITSGFGVGLLSYVVYFANRRF